MLSVLENLHQNVSQAIIQLRELERYKDDFTAAKKAELQATINRLIGDAQRKMDEVPDHRTEGRWTSSDG